MTQYDLAVARAEHERRAPFRFTAYDGFNRASHPVGGSLMGDRDISQICHEVLVEHFEELQAQLNAGWPVECELRTVELLLKLCAETVGAAGSLH